MCNICNIQKELFQCHKGPTRRFGSYLLRRSGEVGRWVTKIPKKKYDTNSSRAGLTNLRHACPKWHAAFTAVPILFTIIFPDQRLYTVRTCAYTHIHDTVQTVFELPLLRNSTAVKHLNTNRSGAKCWPDIYHWGAGLAVTGRIRDIGQNILKSLQTGNSSRPVTSKFSPLSHSS